MAQSVLTVAPDQEEAELLARLAEARRMIRHAIIAAGLDPGIAAGACAELAESRVAAARAQAGLDSLMAGHERERDLLNAVVADLRTERDRLAAELAEARKPLLVRVVEAIRSW